MLPHLWKNPGSVHKLKGAIFAGKYSFALIFNMPKKNLYWVSNEFPWLQLQVFF